MKRAFSLWARTLVVSFLCMCAVLAAGFFALNVTIEGRIRAGIGESLQRSQQQLDLRGAEYNRRNAELVATFSEDAALKAAVGLLRESSELESRSAVRRTIEDELREISLGLDYDILIVIDAEGEVAASTGGDGAPVDDREAKAVLTASGSPALVRLGRTPYDVTTVPINLGTDNLGFLVVGKKFDLGSLDRFGYTVLAGDSGIVASTLPDILKEPVERQISGRCALQKNGCEFRTGRGTYLILEMNRAGLGPHYRLFSVASIDDAMRVFTRGLRRAFILTGAGGILMALVLALFVSRSISRPLTDLASHLEKSGVTGVLWSEFPVKSSTLEVNLLASSLNHAASARRQVEAELRRAKEAAEAASRAKSDFLSNVSHELRTPMNGIMGMTELVLDSELTPEQREDLGLVKFSADRLLVIINDVLDFSRVDGGKLTLDLAEFSLHETLRSALKQLEPGARQKGLEFAWNVTPKVPDLMVGDASRLQQVVTTLAGNAIKFTERGRVDVTVEREIPDSDYGLHFVVEDTGAGISVDKQKLIFDAFSQADGSSTRAHGGLGLGLAIASRLVEMMQGRIWVESEAGRGSRFHFTARFGALPNAHSAMASCEDRQLTMARPAPG